jgi:hypothetical protein
VGHTGGQGADGRQAVGVAQLGLQAGPLLSRLAPLQHGAHVAGEGVEQFALLAQKGAVVQSHPRFHVPYPDLAAMAVADLHRSAQNRHRLAVRGARHRGVRIHHQTGGGDARVLPRRRQQVRDLGQKHVQILVGAGLQTGQSHEGGYLLDALAKRGHRALLVQGHRQRAGGSHQGVHAAAGDVVGSVAAHHQPRLGGTCRGHRNQHRGCLVGLPGRASDEQAVVPADRFQGGQGADGRAVGIP